MIDLWEQLHTLFEVDVGEDMQPEIYIDNLSRSVQRTLIGRLLLDIKEINTSFAIPDPYTEVMVKSPEAVTLLLTQGSLIGALFGQLRMDGYAMPPLGFIFDEPGYMTIVFQVEDDWNALSIIALFEFFRCVKAMDRDAIIHLSPSAFDRQSRVMFKSTLEEYLNEKAKSA